MSHRVSVKPKPKNRAPSLGERWSAWLRRPGSFYPPSELVAEIRAKYEGTTSRAPVAPVAPNG